jgi:Fe-Mn family superoxide dismutase
MMLVKMMPEKQVKPLKYTELNGISAKQLAEHHDVLYAGYVKKLNEIRSKLVDADLSEANASYSFYGELKRQETFTANAIRLHEMYFDNLGGDGVCTGDILQLINEDFGSFEAWKDDMMAAGICARGWVVCAFDWTDGHIYNYVCDAHNLGCIWGCSPLVVLDVYEHAYFIDYATARKNYLDAFFRNLDYSFVNNLISQWNIMTARSNIMAMMRTRA